MRSANTIRVINFQAIKFTIIMLMPVLIACDKGFAQQGAQFTQYMFNGLILNPAYAGAHEALSLTFIQRRQWEGVENGPVTQTFSAHSLFKKKHIGLGFSIVNDKIGVHKNLSVLTHYAYHIEVKKNTYLSMGILAGIHNRKSDYASLAGLDNNDPKLFNPYIAHTFMDFGAGLYLRSPKFEMGLSVPEMIPATYAVNDTISIQMGKANYFLFSKYRIPVKENIGIEPGFLFKYLPGVPLSFDVNINMIFHQVLTTGFSYRKSESVDFLLKGQITPQLQFGYAYDYPIHEISRLSNGSHELMINYLFRYIKANVASPR